MIDIVIRRAWKRQHGKGHRWLVLHPSNDAILAYCDTEGEADAVIQSIDALAELKLRETAR